MAEKTAFIDFNSFINSISLSLDLAEGAAFKDKSKKINFNVPIPRFSIYNHNFASHSKRTVLTSLCIAEEVNMEACKNEELWLYVMYIRL